MFVSSDRQQVSWHASIHKYFSIGQGFEQVLHLSYKDIFHESVCLQISPPQQLQCSKTIYLHKCVTAFLQTDVLISPLYFHSFLRNLSETTTDSGVFKDGTQNVLSEFRWPLKNGLNQH